ncbi:MAG: hypothetical protein AAGI38_23180, partial [Bacteroidota bacterium]
MSLLFLGILSLGITSCDNDDDGNVDPDDGQQVDSGWLIGSIVLGTNGNSFYLGAFEEIPSTYGTAELEKSTEIGLGTRLQIFGNNIYSRDENARTVTKWKVDRTTLEIVPEAIMSFVASGYSGRKPAVFLSETQAFFQDLVNGYVLEWNPTTMEITKTHNVTPLDLPPNLDPFSGPFSGEARGDKIYYPIRYLIQNCCDLPVVPFAKVAVFDPATSSIEYIEDTRALGGMANSFMVDENDVIYHRPDRDNSWMRAFFNVDTSSLPTVLPILRLNADGRYDESFKIDLNEVIPDIQSIPQVQFVLDDKMVFTYSTYKFDAFDDRNQMYNTDFYKTVSLDLNTQNVEPFTPFDQYNSISLQGKINGSNYFSYTCQEVI